MMMEIKKYIVLLFISFLLGACSNYNQIIKGDDYQEKFRLANEIYEDKNYDRCIILYEQVYQHSPKTDEGEVAYYRLAKSYYQMEDFYMAGYYFSAYIQRFPYSVKNEEALFLTALCSVQNSPEFSLDQTETMTAINNVQQFVDRYPNSNLVDSCNHVIDRLRLKLEIKEFEKNKTIEMTKEQKKLFGIEKLNIKRSQIPAVTHVDYSARIQTVHKETNERYFKFITLYNFATFTLKKAHFFKILFPFLYALTMLSIQKLKLWVAF